MGEKVPNKPNRSTELFKAINNGVIERKCWLQRVSGSALCSFWIIAATRRKSIEPWLYWKGKRELLSLSFLGMMGGSHSLAMQTLTWIFVRSSKQEAA
jgi:hypothetical protein